MNGHSSGRGGATPRTTTASSSDASRSSFPRPTTAARFRNGSYRSSSLPDGPPTNQSRNPTRSNYPSPDLFASVSFNLYQVPTQVTTRDIENAFKKHCEVLAIDIWLNDVGNRNGKAKVMVKPPTSARAWDALANTNQALLTLKQDSNGKGGFQVRVQVDWNSFRLNEEKMESPLRKPVPRKLDLSAQALHFGSMLQPTELLKMKTIAGISNLKIVISFQMRMIQIFFPIQSLDANRSVTTFQNKVEIRFSRLSVVNRSQSEDGSSATIIFALDHPPDYYRKMQDHGPSHHIDRLRWAENDLWLRQTNCVWDPFPLQNAQLSLNTIYPQLIELGRWTTLALEMNQQEFCGWLVAEQHLHDYNIDTRTLDDLVQHAGERPGLWGLLDIDSTQNTTGSGDLFSLSTHISLEFAVRYQLEVCISRNMFNEHSIDEAFLRELSKLPPERASRMLEFVADRGTRVWNPADILTDPNALFFYPPIQRALSSDYCALVRKATVTPTTTYFSTPTVETNNRVLREFSNHIDRFLRVQFTDELPTGRINYSGDVAKNDDVFTRVFRALKNGIVVGDHHYKFLAFGNSQLRENGAYFFAETPKLTCDSIRRWMGDFDHIKIVAKYAARMGQCFSTTRLIGGMGTPNVEEIADVEHKGFCFTDGVGKISELWAEMIAHHLQRNEISSVFQFRMGGCKGILTVWPKMGNIRAVKIRPSQKKFDGTVAKGLEIIKCSTYAVGTLNQQCIMILSSLGVPDATFMNLLREHVNKINTAMNDEKVAIEELRKRVDENGVTLRIADMVFNGFMRANEPFVWTLIQLWRSWSLKALKFKARIEVPESAFVLGCVDETNTLRGHSNDTENQSSDQYDRNKLPQIFLQVPVKIDSATGSYKDRPEYQVITGLCIVGRNPSLHPGDIRVVEAVDVPAMRHIKNAVVFPMKGDRDIPSMCSGGDLDGDDYFVFWNKELLPKQWNYPPMRDVGLTPEEKDRVELQHLMAFFVIYMKNDSLPQIALAHKAQADLSPGGVMSPQCLELAKLHSMAVDYVKSGVKVTMPQYLRPRMRPHFMESKGRSYRSRGILGQIYDEVKTASFQPIYDLPFDERILSRYRHMPNVNDLMRTARKIKSQYDINMRRVLGQQDIATEFEIWTGFAMSKRKVGSDYKMTEEISKEYRQLRTRFRDLITEGPCGGSKEPEVLWPFVAAMYRITQEEVKIALHECKLKHSVIEGAIEDGGDWRDTINPQTMPLISFPWLFDEDLGRMTKDNGPRVTVETEDDNDGDEKTKENKKPKCNVIASTTDGGIIKSALQTAVNEVHNVASQLVKEVTSLTISGSTTATSTVSPEKSSADSAATSTASHNTEVRPSYNDLTPAEIAEMQYVRHSEGYITHRGEPITLLGVNVDIFGLPKDDDTKADPSPAVTDTEPEQSEVEPEVIVEDDDEDNALINNPLFQ